MILRVLRRAGALALVAATVLAAASAHGAAPIVTPPPLGQCSGEHPARQEVRDLSAEQWTHYLAAVKQLQARATPKTAAAYDRLAYLHHRYASVVHNAAEFLPWHRLFVRTFEYELQQIDPTVAVPYWDSTQEYQRLAAAPFWSDALLGSNGGPHDIVRSGQFAGWVPFYGRGGLRRGGRHLGLLRHWAVPRDLGSGYAAPRLATQARKARTYDAFRQALEGGAHNLVHARIGGDMNDTSFSPNDPVFWMHHAFIDELWSRWQASAPGRAMAYGGERADLHRARLGDRLDGFGDITVRDVMALSKVCVTYDTTIPTQPTTTALRTSAAAVAPTQDVFYIATVSRAQGGTVNFETANGTVLCDRVPLVFAVDTWTATCSSNAARVRRAPGSQRVTATFSGDAADAPSRASVTQRIVARQPAVLWDPPQRVVYGTPLGSRVTAFADRPGRLDYATLATDGKPATVLAPETILPAGFHVLTLTYTPDSGPPQFLTRQLVVDRAPLVILPQDKRISTEEQTPPLTYTIDGFVAGESPSVLAGFLQPVCRAERPVGSAPTDARPAGRYRIACEGGDAPNYTLDASSTATLEVLEPDDPRLDQPPPSPPSLGAGPGPSHRFRHVCTRFHGRLFCGGFRQLRGRSAVAVLRRGRLLARGSSRRRGALLELRLRRRVAPGPYQLDIVTHGRTRRVLIRVIARATAERASVGATTLLCRLDNVDLLLGSHRRHGRRVSRWRVTQAPR